MSYSQSLLQIRKSEANSGTHVASVIYHLTILRPSDNQSASLCIPVTTTGGDQRVTYYITNMNPGIKKLPLHLTTPLYIITTVICLILFLYRPYNYCN